MPASSKVWHLPAGFQRVFCPQQTVQTYRISSATVLCLAFLRRILQELRRYKLRLELLPCKETCTIPTGLSDKISSWTGEIDHKNYSICTICYFHAELQLIRELAVKKSLTITWITSVAVRSRAGFAGRSCLIIASSERKIHISRSIQDGSSHSISIKRTYLWPKT